MRIRYLRRKSGNTFVSVWPPQWASSYEAGAKFAVGEVGVLTSLARRGDRLTLTIIYEGREHVGSLQWDSPPSVDSVEKVLQANLGQALKVISDLDVPES